MNLKISFTWIGLVVFALPMLINLVYVAFPPAENTKQPVIVTHWIETIEQVSRMAYLFAITFLVSRKPIRLGSVWLYLAAIFLVLYYTAWIRYFAGGRNIALLNRAFFLVPMPLEIFPVLYFLCSAIWLHNLPAVILMLFFGAAHLTVSIQSFQ